MAAGSKNSFGARDTLKAGSQSYEVYRLDALERRGIGHADQLPFSIRILLENLLRQEDGRFVHAKDIEGLAEWQPVTEKRAEIAFMPARVLLQDFTGVPAVADLAAMRDAIARMGGDAKKINPLLPAELVIDHSVQVDQFGTDMAFAFNAQLEFQRNVERYQFLRWGQNGFQNFKVVPPDMGICHQVNLEYLARVVCDRAPDGRLAAYPDSLVGTDSHTTMVNGLGVFGWGVGGIEAEAAMLGQPLSMLVPDVVGFKLHGRLPEGATATDLVLTVTEMLRKKGVVGQFVEFYGTGLSNLTLPDRATIANMAPEYGATMGFFPVDAETLAYLRFTGRSAERLALVEAYTKMQGIFRTDQTPDPLFYGHARTRSRQGRTHAGRTQAPAGPRAVAPGEELFCESDGRHGAKARRGEEQRRSLRAVQWLGGDRGHHQLHEHLESFVDAGRRIGSQKGGRARPRIEALGEDEPGARLESRDRLSASGRPDSISGKAEVQSGGLRLHHVYRQ